MDMFNISDLPLAKERLFEDAANTFTSNSCPDPDQEANMDETQSTTNNYEETKKIVDAMKPITMPSLILGAQSDILFPIWQQKVTALLTPGNSGLFKASWQPKSNILRTCCKIRT
jgi:homoserine acetyltransferase